MDERKLLIADDSELNRAILVSVLEKDFDILKADRLLGQRSKTAFDKFFNIIDGNNHRRLVFRH